MPQRYHQKTSPTKTATVLRRIRRPRIQGVIRFPSRMLMTVKTIGNHQRLSGILEREERGQGQDHGVDQAADVGNEVEHSRDDSPQDRVWHTQQPSAGPVTTPTPTLIKVVTTR